MTSDEPSIHETIERGLNEHPAKKGIPFNVLVTLIEVGGSIALFRLARAHGASDVAAYLIGGLGPVAGGLVIWARARKLSGASVSIFAFTTVSALVAVIGSTDPKVLLYKDCAATALVGLIFGGSCLLARKPLTFYMAQRYATDGTHDGMAVFELMWGAYQDFRTGMYVTSWFWAAVFLVQAAGTAVVIDLNTYSTAYNYDQVLPLIATAIGIAGTVVIARHYARRGRARA